MQRNSISRNWEKLTSVEEDMKFGAHLAFWKVYSDVHVSDFSTHIEYNVLLSI